MYALIACEESQRVCTAFRFKGWDAFSCDLEPCSGGRPEWHIQGDVLEILNGENISFITEDGATHTVPKWDMVIAFPPCTDLTVAGSRLFEDKLLSGVQRKSVEFFCQFLSCNADRVAIENPVGIMSSYYVELYFPDLAKKYNIPRKPTQIIQPWMFGDDYTKRTCLWLKNLPKLLATYSTKPNTIEYFEWVDKTGKFRRSCKWYYDTLSLPPKERSKVRSKTFPGIAAAMAEQWG